MRAKVLRRNRHIAVVFGNSPVGSEVLMEFLCVEDVFLVLTKKPVAIGT